MRLTDLLLPFFTSLGIVLGGSIVGSLAGLGSGSPVQLMHSLARSIKIWAVVIAIGGTFPTIRAIESGLWQGEIANLLRQLAILTCSFLGASVGFWTIQTLSGGE